MTFLAPAPLPESEQKKTATAVELPPNPQTCGEIYGHSDSWSDEMIYLSENLQKYEKEYAYARYKAEQLAWVVIELRKLPEYTSEYKFPKELIEMLLNEFDNTFPEKVKPEHRRLPEELETVFGNVKGICKNLNDKLKSGEKISIDDVMPMKSSRDPEWDTGCTYEDNWDAMKDYEDDKESGGAFVKV